VIGGAVRGPLERLDFDALELFAPWCALVDQRCSGLTARLLRVQTPSDGRAPLRSRSEPGKESQARPTTRRPRHHRKRHRDPGRGRLCPARAPVPRWRWRGPGGTRGREQRLGGIGAGGLCHVAGAAGLQPAPGVPGGPARGTGRPVAPDHGGECTLRDLRRGHVGGASGARRPTPCGRSWWTGDWGRSGTRRSRVGASTRAARAIAALRPRRSVTGMAGAVGQRPRQRTPGRAGHGRSMSGVGSREHPSTSPDIR
jgi:hypothetical protein